MFILPWKATNFSKMYFERRWIKVRSPRVVHGERIRRSTFVRLDAVPFRDKSNNLIPNPQSHGFNLALKVNGNLDRGCKTSSTQRVTRQNHLCTIDPLEEQLSNQVVVHKRTGSPQSVRAVLLPNRRVFLEMSQDRKSQVAGVDPQARPRFSYKLYLRVRTFHGRH
jgi:hypothetical protein